MRVLWPMLGRCLAIGAAGFVGALTRWGITLLFRQWQSGSFPFATLFINVTGSFFLGWFSSFITHRYPVSDTFRLAVATGFVGAYTTFSTFMFETVGLATQGAQLQAAANLLGSLLLGLIGVWVGAALGKVG